MSLIFNVTTKSVEVGGKTMSFETGKMAKQAGGAVIVTVGETVVMVTATAAKKAREGIDFFPLTCDYVEKSYAAGRIPGNYFRREGRQNEFEVLNSRLMDRPIRPMFPAGFQCETQVIATVLSHDKVNESAVMAMCGSSAALHISDIPFDGPTAAVRVARINGELVANPDLDALEDADINLLIAVSPDGISMVEGGADFVSEAEIIDALYFAYDACQPIMECIEELRKAAGKTKRVVVAPKVDAALLKKVRKVALAPLTTALAIDDKLERYAALDVVKAKVIAGMVKKDAALGERTKELKDFIGAVKKDIVRTAITKEGRRIGGRGLSDVRSIVTETNLVPRAHGSALFTRGETQALAIVTLGTGRDGQRIETLTGEVNKDFLLHYNFPPYSVGETKFLRGPGRREIGHGALAHRGLEGVLPDQESFPYAIRIVSEVLESNGSSSMASVCGGSMALMAAGVPISSPVAGIAMGLIAEKDKLAVLSDILGDEDHLGDMDFKVVGNYEGISALQMDIKIKGLTRETMEKALTQAREGRLHILDEMAKTIEEPSLDLSPYAPRIFTVVINPEKIRDLIGPGGKHIRGITEQTGAVIDVTDDGKVNVAAADGEIAQKAVDMVRAYTEEAEAGKTYLGVVARVTDFGAFVTIMPGTDGLVHISELDEGRVNTVEDICSEGDEMLVKVINVDRQGKVRLSRREVLRDQRRANGEEVSDDDGGGDRARPPRRDDGGDRGGDRGGSGGGDRGGNGGGGGDRGRSRGRR
ncbi:MAG: polyribonucleotide nucleotidyltransferase [Myxococcota bacterium]|jgi:polyribonucleotide nucleotidyltransferase